MYAPVHSAVGLQTFLVGEHRVSSEEFASAELRRRVKAARVPKTMFFSCFCHINIVLLARNMWCFPPNRYAHVKFRRLLKILGNDETKQKKAVKQNLGLYNRKPLWRFGSPSSSRKVATGTNRKCLQSSLLTNEE